MDESRIVLLSLLDFGSHLGTLYQLPDTVLIQPVCDPAKAVSDFVVRAPDVLYRHVEIR